jgi:hypothetical protein
MLRNYAPLNSLLLQPGSGFCQPTQSMPQRVELQADAEAVMTDFKQVSAVLIRPSDGIDEANRRMIHVAVGPSTHEQRAGFEDEQVGTRLGGTPGDLNLTLYGAHRWYLVFRNSTIRVQGMSLSGVVQLEQPLEPEGYRRWGRGCRDVPDCENGRGHSKCPL